MRARQQQQREWEEGCSASAGLSNCCLEGERERVEGTYDIQQRFVLWVSERGDPMAAHAKAPCERIHKNIKLIFKCVQKTQAAQRRTKQQKINALFLLTSIVWWQPKL